MESNNEWLLIGKISIILTVSMATLIVYVIIKKNTQRKQIALVYENDDNIFNCGQLERRTKKSIVQNMKSPYIQYIENTLTDKQKEEERRVERKQLAEIFDLLKKLEKQLNTSEINEHQLQEQLKLYRNV